MLVAILAFGMPTGLAVMAATQGVAYGAFPIIWILLTAILIYQLSVASGRFEHLRDTFDSVSDDPRVQAVLIAFCFGGLLEALAGFGAPVAITATMIIAMGIAPLRAAAAVLMANTAPVAFGSLAIPITTAGDLTGIPAEAIGAMTGRQAPLLAVFVPFLLLIIIDGRRGLKDCWPVALATGLSFAIAQFVTSNYISVQLTDIVAALVGLVVTVALMRFWQPNGSPEAWQRTWSETKRLTGSVPHKPAHRHLTPGRVISGMFPFLLVVVVFSAVNLIAPLKAALLATDIKIHWPVTDGNILNLAGTAVTTTVYKFNWLSNPGTLLLICAVIVTAIYRLSPAVLVREFCDILYKLRWSILTICSVLGIAYVMNLSGQTITIGTWIAGTGAAFAFFSPVLGWIGTAVTGSETSANALFAKLQQTAGHNVGVEPSLLVAANTSGGVVGKMISPQNLTIAASSVKMDGQEATLLRKMLPWSFGLLLGLCVLVFLQSTVLSWMIP